MNKTIIININGIVFHIEEDAYEILKNYLTDVKRHFLNSADSLEITTDIENRIAEMFNELLAHEGKQVIVEQDVNRVISQMGTVADFEKSEQDTEPTFSDTYYNNNNNRRLFRDPDDHLVAGVAAGIANYFDIQVAWIRLAFALTILAGGMGLLLYIILWIVVPKAVTRADKMAMKGEKLNLEGFKRNFEQELGSVHQNFSNFKNEARPFVYKARDFSGDLAHHLGNFIRGFANVFIKFIGVLILLAGFGFLVFFIVAFIAFISVGHFMPFPVPSEILRHHNPNTIIISAFLVAIIPLISIIMLVLKGIFRVGSVNRSTGTTVLAIWLCAVGVFVFQVIGIVSEFRSHASVVESIALKPTKNNTYYIKLNELKYFTASDSARLDIKNLSPNIKITDDDDNDFESFNHRNIHLDIEASDSNQPSLTESYRARGPFYEAALANARDIKYQFTQQDTVLKFDQRYYGKTDEPWHDEEVYLTLKLPKNAKVVVEHEVGRFVDFNIGECNEANKKDYNKVTDATFVITDNGLQCKVDTLVTDTIIRKHLPIDSTKIKVK